MIESADPKSIFSELITSKSIDRKLKGDNYLQWRKIVKINLIDCEKNNHLYTDPPSSKIDEWEREDAALFGQLLNIIKPKIQDLVIHTSTVKKM